MSPNTIRRGLADLKQPLEDSPYRVRQPGGGRKPVEKKDPAVIQALENLLQDVTAGDPSTGMKWTHKSIRRLCRTRAARGSPFVGPPFGVCCISVSIACERIANGWLGHTTRIGTASFDTWSVSAWLSEARLAGDQRGHENEGIGGLQNPGRCWRCQERAVLDHDFRRHAVGIGIPMGSMTRAGTLGSSYWVCPTTRRHLQSLPSGSGGFRSVRSTIQRPSVG